MRTLRALFAFGTLAAIAAAPAAFGQGQTSGPTRSATIVDFDFQPRDLTVDLGTTIAWRNEGDRPHTVTDRGGVFDTNPIAPGGTGSVTFTVPGRYLYFCRINPGRMNGVVVVRPGAQPSRVNRIQAIDPAREGERLRFDPADLSVEAGSTIVFANVGGKPHTLTADDGSFDSGVVTPGAEGGRFAGSNATVTPSRPGRFPFHCEVHPEAMKGVLTVTGQARDAPAAASSAPTRVDVGIEDFAFDPAEASVAPGGRVTFSNTGQAPHTATLDDVQLDTGRIEPGGDATLDAPVQPGSYSYRCAIHPGRMRAVLVVVGQNVEDPTRVQAAGPAAATGGGGAGGGVTALALATGVIGAFLGGFAISAFVRNGMGATSG